MPGERWDDKRARAVLFAGANKLARDAANTGDATPDPDAVADTGLVVRDLLFVAADVREENADIKAHRIGYTRDCMQFATLEAGQGGLWLGLWVGPAKAPAAKAAMRAEDDPNAFRRLFGWIRVPVLPGSTPPQLGDWIEQAVRHAADEKARQAQAEAAKKQADAARKQASAAR